MNKIKEYSDQYTVDAYTHNDLQLCEGKGALIYDEKGKEYIDLGAGIAVNIFGIADEEWCGAVNAQLCKIQHTSNLYYTEPQALLAKLICEKTGMKKVFFSNSGAEANECAIKAARKYSFDKYGKDRSTIITLKNSFHGRTITTLAATGQDSFHTMFAPFTEGFVYADSKDFSSVEKLAAENKVCAVMIELVQGEGGIMALDKEYVNKLADFTAENDILLIVDEVQTGNGRTGTLYSYMQYGITPDIFTTAKGLGGGLPIGAAVFGEKTMNVLTPSTHGSTFGGNPVCAAGALSILSRIDDELLKGVQEKSKYIISRLKSSPSVKNVSGLGLMLGFECGKEAKQVVKECMEKGVLVLTAKNKVRLVPPLNITEDLLKRAMDIIIEVVKA